MSLTTSRVSAPGFAVAVTESDVAIRLRVADSWATRARGLLGTARLTLGTGLLLTPCGSVHTSLMRYPIDVVYLDADGEIVKVAPDVRPWRFTSGGKRARMTLEMAAGDAARLRLVPGGHLTIRPGDSR